MSEAEISWLMSCPSTVFYSKLCLYCSRGKDTFAPIHYTAEYPQVAHYGSLHSQVFFHAS
jgi:hypothetical protein